MDNITHTLVGAALAETGLKRVTPLATTTLLLAANLPDIDIITLAFGRQAYLHYHRGLTHSLIGVPLLATLLAALMWAGSRWIIRPTRTERRARFLPLLMLSWLAMWTHPLLDFTNAYGWRPFLPWSDRWYYGDIAFVVDLWIWGVMGGVMFLVATRVTESRAHRWLIGFWAALFIVTAAVVVRSDSASINIKLLWLGVVAVIAIGRWLFPLNDQQSRRLSLGLLVVLLAYFGALTLLHRAALSQGEVMSRAITGERVWQISAMPLPANPRAWTAVVTTDQAFYFADWHWLGAELSLSSATRYARATGDTAAILAVQHTNQGQAFLRFARFPATEVRPRGEQFEVIIRDLRFLSLNTPFQIQIRLDKNLRPIADSPSN